VALKPVLYGSLAAEIAGVPHTVNALTGLGYVFTSESIGARLLGLFIRPLLRLVLKRKKSRVILQNRDDLEWLTALGLVDPARTKLIRGSGVDTKKFKPRTAPRPPGPLVAMMAARALVDKGIREFVDAGRILAERGADVRLVFVGAPDPANPGSVSEERLRRWQQQGWIEWWGFQEDMAEVWAEADIAVLPSYREGLPKTLLEAAAAGLPLVATDVPGCREIVREGETGLLVPVGDSRALADAIARLARDELFRHRLAHNVRYTAEREFSEEIVAQETLRLYKDLIGKR
jgi:glycosyltransferase involved in cell wall biosynthesis